MGHIIFAEEYDDDYLDWVSLSEDGVDYTSYLVSGYKVQAQGDKKFQSNYVTVNYGEGSTALDENQSAYFQGIWGYAIDPSSGKYSSQQQVVNPNTAAAQYNYGIRKLKVRGTGKVLQFKITSETARPFWINGWTVFITGDQTV